MLLFEIVPMSQCIMPIQQILEARIGASLAEAIDHVLVFIRQLLLGERKREIAAGLKITLVRQHEIAI